MKAFILRILTFSALLFAILFCIKNSLPYSWGNSKMTQKIEHISNNPESYDCLFFGSSKAFRHIDPILFDSITDLNSYNMGSAGVLFLETHYLIEHFLKEYPSKQTIKIFLIDKKTARREEENFRTVERKYYLDFKRLKIGISEFLRREEGNYYKQYYQFLISYIDNQLCVGELEAIKDFYFEKVRKMPEFVLLEQKGFYSLEQELELTANKKLFERNEVYMNSEVAKEGKKLSTQEKKMIIEQLSSEELNMNTYGKKVEFFHIKPIELEVGYHFDKNHFNDKGAEIYTRKLADAVNELKRF